MSYHSVMRPRPNFKSSLSIFGTQKFTAETYLLNCVFNHYKPFAPDKIILPDNKVESLKNEFSKYSDCFIYNDDVIYKTKQGVEYHWEFIPTREFLIDYEDKLNRAFYCLSKPSRFMNGEFHREEFNPNKIAYTKQMKSEFHKKIKKGEIKKTSLNEYLEKKGAL